MKIKWILFITISFIFAFTKYYIPSEWHYLWGALAGSIMMTILMISEMHKPLSQLTLSGITNAIKVLFYKKKLDI